jgi:hypothetical protein
MEVPAHAAVRAGRMMSFDFPDNPVPGQTFEPPTGPRYVWWNNTWRDEVALGPVAPPVALKSVTPTAPAPYLGGIAFDVLTEEDANLWKLQLWRAVAGAGFATAIWQQEIDVPRPGDTYRITQGHPEPNVPNGGFDAPGPPPGLDLGYSIAGGQLSHPLTMTAAMDSSDGVTWTIRPTPIDAAGTLPYFDVCRAESPRNLWVAVANSGDLTKAVMTSPDGVTWTPRALPEVIAPNGVAYSPTLDRFVIAGFSGTNRGATSQDGITWVPIPVANLAALSWRDVTWSPEKAAFCIVAQTSSTSAIAFSPDGLTWTRRASAGQGQWQAVKWCKGFNAGAGFFVMVGNAGAFRTATAVDAGPTGFVGRATDQNMFLRCLGYSPTLNRVVAGGNSGTARLVTSTDGITWVDITATCGLPNAATDWQIADIKWIGDKFVLVANNGVATSTDGLNWTVQYQPPWQNWKALDYSVEQDRVVAVSQANGISYHVAWWDQPFAINDVLRFVFDVASASGTLQLATVDGFNKLIRTLQSSSAAGIVFGELSPAPAASARVAVLTAQDISQVTNAIGVYKKGAFTYETQGVYDYWVVPVDAAGIQGPATMIANAVVG